NTTLLADKSGDGKRRSTARMKRALTSRKTIGLPVGVTVKRTIEEIRPKLGSTKRTNRVLEQPLIGTLQ
ncbi:hypothetical protein Dimus_029908, partial [Dionaea muscipula]